MSSNVAVVIALVGIMAILAIGFSSIPSQTTMQPDNTPSQPLTSGVYIYSGARCTITRTLNGTVYVGVVTTNKTYSVVVENITTITRGVLGFTPFPSIGNYTQVLYNQTVTKTACGS